MNINPLSLTHVANMFFMSSAGAAPAAGGPRTQPAQPGTRRSLPAGRTHRTPRTKGRAHGSAPDAASASGPNPAGEGAACPYARANDSQRRARAGPAPGARCAPTGKPRDGDCEARAWDPPIRMRGRRPGRTASLQRAPRSHGVPGSAAPEAHKPGSWPSPAAISELGFRRGRGPPTTLPIRHVRPPGPRAGSLHGPEGTLQVPALQCGIPPPAPAVLYGRDSKYDSND